MARFVLTAHIDDVQTLNCHLSYVQPQQLYAYTYRIRYPQLKLESELRRVSAEPLNDGSAMRQPAEDEYLTVSHQSVFKPTTEDVILQGKQVNENWNYPRYAFSVHNLKRPAEFHGRNPKRNNVYNSKTDTYSLTFQTGVPFAINNLVHSPRRRDHRCPRDVGDVYDKQAIYKSDGIPVTVQSHKGAKSRWFDVTPLNKPTITFSLKGSF